MECYPLKHHFLSRTIWFPGTVVLSRGYALGKRVDTELQSEVRSWGSSSNEPFFPSASFLTEGEMFICGTWTLADRNDPALRENLQPSRSLLCFCPTAFCPLFLTSFLNCSCGLFLRDTLACRSQFISSFLLTTGESAHCSLKRCVGKWTMLPQH